MCAMVHNANMTAKKSEDIKVRVDPLTKNTLIQIAESETLDLSDIVRFAIRDYVSRRTQMKVESRTSYAST